MASTSSSVSSAQKASNHDEFFMQQSLIFSDTLKDLKNLRKQLYSAAEFFEASYIKQDHKHIVVETSKDYAIKALINTIDHLGSVAFKVNNLLDEKIGKVSETELRFTCLEKRVQSCKEFINQYGLYEQLSVIKTPRYHKRYIFPVEENEDDLLDQTTSNNQSGSCLSAEEDLQQFQTAAQATTMQSPSSYVRELHSTLQSPQPSGRQGTFSFTRISDNKKHERRATSPSHFIRVGSLLKRSPSPSHSNAKRQYPSEPRRSVSMSPHTEKNRSNKDFEQYSSKSKRLFKALLSMRKTRKEGTLNKFLDEN